MRWRAIGRMRGRLYTLIYTVRGDNIRIISLRRANAGEVRTYDQSH